MKKIKAILFDLDDTLVKTREVRSETFKVMAQKYNRELSDQTIHDAWFLPMGPFMKKLYGDIDSYENLMALYDQVKEDFPNKPTKNAVSTIQTLSSHVHLGVISSAAKQWILHDLETVGFNPDHFAHIQGSEETEYHKPHPDVFLPVKKKLSKTNITPDEVLYVGDGLSDYYAAKAAGFHFLGLAESTTPKHEFEKVGAKTITSLSDLIGYIN